MYCSVALSVASSVGGTIGLSSVDGTFKLWQYCISTLGLLITSIMPALWYLTCHAIVRAAKNLGDEIEQV